MAVQGVPIPFSKSDITSIIKKNKGVVTQICREMNIDRSTFYEHHNADEDLQAALKAARTEFMGNLCDMSENTFVYAFNHKETNLSDSLSAAKYCLNNLGPKLGLPYSMPQAQASDASTAFLQPILETHKALQEKYDEQSKRLEELERKQFQYEQHSGISSQDSSGRLIDPGLRAATEYVEEERIAALSRDAERMELPITSIEKETLHQDSEKTVSTLPEGFPQLPITQ